MKKIIKTMIILIFVIPYAFSQSFEIWAESSNLITIGKNEIIQVYVKNTDSSNSSYSLYFSKRASHQTRDVSHLINVNFPSNVISNLEPSKVGSTIATITILGPIDEAEITFTAISGSVSKSYTIRNIKAGFPVSLDELNIITLFILMLILLSLNFTKIL